MNKDTSFVPFSLQIMAHAMDRRMETTRTPITVMATLRVLEALLVRWIAPAISPSTQTAMEECVTMETAVLKLITKPLLWFTQN